VIKPHEIKPHEIKPHEIKPGDQTTFTQSRKAAA
jgi:hypothetical protein